MVSARRRLHINLLESSGLSVTITKAFGHSPYFHPAGSMLASYADETGHSKDPRRKFVGIAGLVTSTNHWEEFDREWREICAQEQVKLPFHMLEFAGRKRQFSAPQWQVEDNRKRLLRRLLGAIERAQAIPIGALVSLHGFNGLTENQKSRLRDPYFRAFQSVTYNLVFAGAIAGDPPGKISMTYAKLRKYTSEANKLWEAMRDANPHIAWWMGSYSVGQPEEHTPLQAADIWAYELGHHFESIVPKRLKPRWAFARLTEMAFRLANGCEFFTYFDRRRMLRTLGDPY